MFVIVLIATLKGQVGKLLVMPSGDIPVPSDCCLLSVYHRRRWRYLPLVAS
jgi:hypothetical protein